jgi:arylsulfatase A-like enzyme
MHQGLGEFQRITLDVVPGLATPEGPSDSSGPDSILISHLVPPPEIAPWAVQAPGGAIYVPASENGDPDPGLLLRGAGEKVLSVPGRYDPQSFNQIALRGIFVESVVVRLQLLRQGKAVLGTRGQTTSSARSSQIFFFDIPELRRQVRDLDEIRVLVSKESTRCVIQSLDLLQRPLARWLPAPGGEPDLVGIHFDLRRGWGLTSRTPLQGRGRLAEGSRLRFSYGSPESLRLPRQSPRLRVTLTDERGHERVETFGLEADLSTRSRWHAADLDLHGFEGSELFVRFELEVRRGHLGLCVVAEPVLYVPGRRAPTVLLVTSDTHRADHLGVAGTGLVRTPALDSLAARGVLFTDCLAATNVTNPSHVALMTATHPRDTRIVDNHHPLSPAAPTLAEAFREAGYVTYAGISARHLVEEESGLGQGFDRMSSPGVHQRGAEITTQITRRWLDESAGLPLFVWLHLFDVHTPYAPPAEYDRRYYPKDRDPFSPDLPDPPFSALIVSGTPLADLRDADFPAAQYRAEVDYLDDQLGAFLNHERFADALIVFTADHGESFGQHGVYYDHAELYPDTIHVPLILTWPGGPAGVVSSTPVRQIDVGRTLLNICGLEQHAFPGHDLRDDMNGATSADPRFGLSSAALSASVNLNGWHLILHLKSHHQKQLADRRERHSLELYHLREDPECLVNRVDGEPERAARLRALLVDWLGQAPQEGWSTSGNADPEILKRLANLGYATFDDQTGVGDWFEADCDCDWCTRFAPE